MKIKINNCSNCWNVSEKSTVALKWNGFNHFLAKWENLIFYRACEFQNIDFRYSFYIFNSVSKNWFRFYKTLNYESIVVKFCNICASFNVFRLIISKVMKNATNFILDCIKRALKSESNLWPLPRTDQRSAASLTSVFSLSPFLS